MEQQASRFRRLRRRWRRSRSRATAAPRHRVADGADPQRHSHPVSRLGYMIRIASRLAHMNGWAEEQVTAMRTCTPTSDAKIDVLTDLVREAAANSGNVTDATWKAAQQAGWSDKQLTDAFAYLGATVFTGYFLNYAQTDMDALW